MVSESYSFLVNFASLIEVITAIYMSMLIDNFFSGIWTPGYKKRLSKMIEDMKIPGVKIIADNVSKNIDNHANVIKGHMRRKASFFVVFCLSLLLLAGLESHSSVLPQYGYRLVFSLSCVAFIFMIFGKWAFLNLSRVFVCIFVYVLTILICYFTPLLRLFPDMHIATEKSSICFLLAVLFIPIMWQIFILWIYSNLYEGFMRYKITKEAYLYGRAFIAYRLRNMTALPVEYQLVARDFLNPPVDNQDASLESLTKIITGRLEMICNPPKPLVIVLSRIKHQIYWWKEKELEYIQSHGFDYDTNTNESDAYKAPRQ